MPELPEVEVLCRHLRGRLPGRRVRGVEILVDRICRPHHPSEFALVLTGRRFLDVQRRAKYLVFVLRAGNPGTPEQALVAHLGMTGRMYLQSGHHPPPRHLVARLTLDRGVLIFEDPRRFGRLALGVLHLSRKALGPEPLDSAWTAKGFALALAGSHRPIKTHLLDQKLVVGLGNIYASEALFRAGIHPAVESGALSLAQVVRLHRAVRSVLRKAIAFGSTLPLDWEGAGSRDGLFYFGSAPEATSGYEERLRVYGRDGLPCWRCGTAICRMDQAGRSTFYCPECQLLPAGSRIGRRGIRG